MASQNGVIAIDGPVASGKTVVGRTLAQRLGFSFVDTGIMYRAITWLVLHRGAAVDDAGSLGRLAQANPVHLVDGDSSVVKVAGKEVGPELRDPEVEKNVSLVSRVAEVREAMVAQQRDLAAHGSMVMIGRDIGTVVLPEAGLKVYLLASPEQRARRRWKEMRDGGQNVALRDGIGTNEATRRDRFRKGQLAPQACRRCVALRYRRPHCRPSGGPDHRAGGGNSMNGESSTWLYKVGRRCRPLLFQIPGPAKGRRAGKRSSPWPGDPGLQPPLLYRPAAVGGNDAAAPLLRGQEGIVQQSVDPVRDAQVSTSPPIDRSSSGLDAVRILTRHLEKDRTIVIFPEGRRSPDHTLQQAMLGIAYLAVKSQAPILPVGVTGTHKISAWRMPVPLCRLTTSIGPPFTLPVLEGKPSREVLKSIADMIMERVAAQLPPEFRGAYGKNASIPREAGAARTGTG